MKQKSKCFLIALALIFTPMFAVAQTAPTVGLTGYSATHIEDANIPSNTVYTPTSTGTGSCYSGAGQIFNVYVTSGNSTYAHVNYTGTGSAFTVDFDTNNNPVPRNAVVRVVDKCSGAFADYIFSQAGGYGCGAMVRRGGIWAFVQFQCFNLGATPIPTQTPFIPGNTIVTAANLQGDKYIFGGTVPAMTQSDDQQPYNGTQTPSRTVHVSPSAAHPTPVLWNDLYENFALTYLFAGSDYPEYLQWNSNGTGVDTWGMWGLPRGADPCTLKYGAGWRIPTNVEWTDVIDETHNPRTYVAVNGATWTTSGAPTNGQALTDFSTGVNFGGHLFLPAAGWRDFGNGTLNDRGANGDYWSSTGDGSTTQADYMWFTNGNAFTGYVNGFGDRTTGYSVRCISAN